ncbi:MAG: nucleoside-diphosphate kinase [Acidobacteria bacterium]|nr:nucleoside-diphosphate kinase [Acidobacteriota bacterium]
MPVERTLAIIKPDAMRRALPDEILKRIRQDGFRIVAQKELELTKKQAEGFYAVHRGKPFFAPLCEFMSSDKVLVMVLEAENAIARWREVMGATDPAKAVPGTIRRQYGTDIQRNAVHGSDGPDTAAFEIGYFFAGYELV